MRKNDPLKPLIVQSDGSLLLDVHAKGAEEAREAIAPFAELEKSPEHVHSYRISPLSLWNAASAGLSPETVVESLRAHSRYELPSDVAESVSETMARFGRLSIVASSAPDRLLLVADSEALRAELGSSKALAKYIRPAGDAFSLALLDRGSVKLELMKIGWPARDDAPLIEGERLELALRQTMLSGKPFGLRPYQLDSIRAFLGGGGPGTSYGVIVLPCGSGKTVVGMGIMAQLKTNCLILTTNVAATHQWIDEIIDKTDLKSEDIGEYSGDRKVVRPVTIATYQILTWRPGKDEDFPHLSLFRARNWGLIIYDEVHLLPAPVFRITAELQAVKRLGLTATLVREDHRESDVFALVGPKRFDVPWRELERGGFIAEASCREIRIELPRELDIPYASAERREKYRIAAENPLKDRIVAELVETHHEDIILVIGQYIDQLKRVAKQLGAPLITGSTPNPERERLYADFRAARIRVLVVSKVANFAIDLPDASMAIQISGSFGSRQEEAQRLGRILRPKKRNSLFCTIVSGGTVEELFAANRQKFLAEQGYRYTLERWDAEELA